MARINIYDCWWTDPRRSALVSAVGQEEEADGVALKAWRVSQEFWRHDRSLVPLPIFSLLRFASTLLQVGLAEQRSGGVYVKGSCDYHDWIHERIESARKGGKNSAASRSNKIKTLAEANGKQIQPSFSLSLSKRIKSIVESKFDLESAYQKYPRKEGKTPGLKKLAKEIKTDQDFQDLLLAISRYSVSVQGKEIGFIKMFSTFAGQWRDYIETPCGKKNGDPAQMYSDVKTFEDLKQEGKSDGL